VLLGGLGFSLIVAVHADVPAISSLPSEVAGVRIPDSPLARKAAALSRASCPPYLFNHCMRTFVFGALSLKKQHLAYRADDAFVSAALHDLGLLPAFESKNASFEIDGADAAEKFALENGLSKEEADIIWHGVEMHDGKWALTKRQGPEAMLVSIGAGTDVDGPDPDVANPQELAEVLQAFPRLNFKKEFTALAIGHCRRKPLSQRGTWLEGLCREQRPDVWTDTVESEIAKSGYAE
jgi:hypothetical protein